MGMDQQMISKGRCLGSWRKFYELNDWMMKEFGLGGWERAEVDEILTPEMVRRLEAEFLPLLEDYMQESFAATLRNVKNAQRKGYTVRYQANW
jgi:hypothetical protein